MEYKIPACNMESLREKLSKIERKCKKYNCEFYFVEKETIFEEDERQKGTFNKFIIIDVSGTAKINNWEFIAEIEHETTGNIIFGTGKAFPKRFYNATCECEHCKVARYRKNTYIVHNIETDEYKQVGKACLKDFTNGLSAEAVANYESYFKSISDYEDLDFCGNYGNSYYFKTAEILPYAFEVVKKYGYVKSTEFNSTKEKVYDFFLCENFPARLNSKKREYIISEIERTGFNGKSSENIEKSEKAVKWIFSQNPENDYIANLQNVLKVEYFDNKFLGIVSSVPAVYNKAVEREEKQKAEKTKTAKSEFIGKEKERITIKVDTCKCVYSYDTEYGYMHIYQMIDESGNVLTWKTGTVLENDCFEKPFTMTGTVKKHSDYKGTKQTELTRCKIVF